MLSIAVERFQSTSPTSKIRSLETQLSAIRKIEKGKHASSVHDIATVMEKKKRAKWFPFFILSYIADELKISVAFVLIDDAFDRQTEDTRQPVHQCQGSHEIRAEPFSLAWTANLEASSSASSSSLTSRRFCFIFF